MRVPLIQEGSGDFLRYKEEVRNISGTGGSGESSGTGRKWGVPQGQG